MDTMPKEKRPVLSLGKKHPCTSPGCGKRAAEKLSEALVGSWVWGSRVPWHQGWPAATNTGTASRPRDVTYQTTINWSKFSGGAPSWLEAWGKNDHTMRKEWPCMSVEISRGEMFSPQPMFTLCSSIGLASRGSLSTHILRCHACFV